MKNNKKEKLALILLGAMLVTNPLSGQYVLAFLEEAFKEMFIYGAWVTLIAGAYFCGLMFYALYKSREVINVPKKSAKTLKAGKLLEY